MDNMARKVPGAQEAQSARAVGVSAALRVFGVSLVLVAPLAPAGSLVP